MVDALALGAQAVLVVLSIVYDLGFRYVRRQPGTCFANMSAVIASELLKLICSALMMLATLGGRDSARSLARMGTTNVRATAMFAVPSVLYTIQNFVYFVAQSNLSVTFYLVTKQLAIPMTALTWVLVRQRPLSAEKWLALCIVLVGVVALGWKGDTGTQGNTILGLASILMGVFLSSVSSIVMEKLLQDSEDGIWEVNFQLASFGLVIAMCTFYATEGAIAFEQGPFRCFTALVWGCMGLQACVGLATAVVLKLTNAVTKVVAKAFAMVSGSMMSRLVFQEGPELLSPQFLVGLTATTAGTMMYSLGAPAACARCLGSGPAAAEPAGKPEPDAKLDSEVLAASPCRDSDREEAGLLASKEAGLPVLLACDADGDSELGLLAVPEDGDEGLAPEGDGGGGARDAAAAPPAGLDPAANSIGRASLP